MIEQVRRLEVLHSGCGVDGYSTFVKVNGSIGPEMDPPRYDKKVRVWCEAGGPVLVRVTWCDDTVTHYVPEQFDMRLGSFEVHTRPDRFPCLITLGGVEPRVRSFEARVEARQGEAPWVHLYLEILPKELEHDEPTLVIKG